MTSSDVKYGRWILDAWLSLMMLLVLCLVLKPLLLDRCVRVEPLESTRLHHCSTDREEKSAQSCVKRA